MACTWPQTEGASFTCSHFACWNVATVVASVQQILKPAGDEDSCSVLMSCGEIVLQNLRATYGIRLRRAVNSIKREVAGFFFFFFLTVFVKMFFLCWSTSLTPTSPRRRWLPNHSDQLIDGGIIEILSRFYSQWFYVTPTLTLHTQTDWCLCLLKIFKFCTKVLFFV